MKIAMVSEHASPLAVLGGDDAGGQNVHVAALASALADRGHTVEVFTRRDARGLPEVVQLHPGVDVVHVPAGPARAIGKDADRVAACRTLVEPLRDAWREAAAAAVAG